MTIDEEISASEEIKEEVIAMDFNHDIIETTKNDEGVSCIVIGNKYFVFCDCGNAVEVFGNPDGKVIRCAFEERDFWVNMCHVGICYADNEQICIPDENGIGKCGASCLKCDEFHGTWDCE